VTGLIIAGYVVGWFLSGVVGFVVAEIFAPNDSPDSWWVALAFGPVILPLAIAVFLSWAFELGPIRRFILWGRGKVWK
jgi:hypothetical protein